MPRNLVWGLGLTGNATLDGRTRLVLGILDHPSRAALGDLVVTGPTRTNVNDYRAIVVLP